MVDEVRSPACPGRFYPADPDELRAKVREYLGGAEVGAAGPPEAVVAPHAGYVFSGPVAGRAFAALGEHRDDIDRAVLVGPSHFVRVEGLAVPSHDAFRTPLGRVAVDCPAVEELREAGLVEEHDGAHRREHSLETHLPFLQELFGDDFEIVPVVTGPDAGAEVERLLDRLWEADGTVVSVSSDLSHYLDYESANEVDAETRDAIERLDAGAIDRRRACGWVALRGLLAAASSSGLEPETLAMCNSGDTGGDRNEVVGYGAWTFAAGSN